MYKRTDLKDKLTKYYYKNADLAHRNVLVRSCLNVPLKNGVIQDMTRINESLVLLKELKDKAPRVVIMAHLGRPEGRDEAFSLKPVKAVLEKELGEQVVFAEDPDSDWINQNTASHVPGRRIVLLENIRFFAGEESKNKGEQAVFADQLSRLGSIFINDAFADYRESASTYGVAQIMPSFLGPVFYKEVAALSEFVNPKRPFMAVMAGVKLSEKLDSLQALLDEADKVMVGGALAYTLLKAEGKTTGISLVEDEKLQVAKDILNKYREKILLPLDHIAVKEFKQPQDDSGYIQIDGQDIPAGLMGVDIGPKTREIYQAEIAKANSLLWNGPLGIYEWGKTAAGTDAIITAMIANKHAYKLIGGGDSITVTNQLNVNDYDHICTGGGAMLAFLAYDRFPTLDVILDQI